MNNPNCRICGATGDQQQVRANTVFGGKPEHKFFECSECGAIYLFPVPSEEEEKRFYKQEFERYMATRAGVERDWTNAEKHIQTNQDQVKRRWAFIEEYLKPEQKLLEIGCSTGFMLDRFREYGADVSGIELSDEFLPFLRQRGHKVYSSIEILKKDNPEVKFDIITHFFVFEHMRDPFSFLESTYSMLKSGGYIIAEVPCSNDPLTSLYDIPAFEEFYWSIAHHYYYTPKSIKFVLDKLGYDYEIKPEQRYDISNHMYWMMAGKPGGQGKFDDIFSAETNRLYKEDLKSSWKCDTMFIYVRKP